MMKMFSILLLLLLPVRNSSTQEPEDQSSQRVGGGCEGCSIMFDGMPKRLNWETSLIDSSEPGERLEISGVILKPDGRQPAPGVILYVYQTDSRGSYTPSENQHEGRRHGHLRGWVKSNAAGMFKFKTIRPASYPNSSAPQHIHPIVKEPNIKEYWIDEFVFTDDPLLTAKERAGRQNRGGDGIITLTKNPDGVWVGYRTIVLGKNIPGHLGWVKSWTAGLMNDGC